VKGRGGEVDSDAQLEQGRRLAKAGPSPNSARGSGVVGNIFLGIHPSRKAKDQYYISLFK